jgi:hypothetical protein
MRFDVHTVRCHLVNELMQAPQVQEVWHDGSDVVLLDFISGETISIHLVERYMSVDEINYIFSQNNRQGLYTMLILWGAMFMPSDGQVYQPDDWMLTLLHLYDGKIYAFDAWRETPYIFTVSFNQVGEAQQFIAHHGGDVNIRQIGTATVETALRDFSGFWRVARFDGYAAGDDASFWENAQQIGTGNPTIRHYLNLLGLGEHANHEQVKAAYREMARKHHPDHNQHIDTTQQMQLINDAYLRVLRYLDQQAEDISRHK